MANAITTLVIVHSPDEDAASLAEELLPEDTGDVQGFLRRLRSYVDRLLVGSSHAEITATLDTGGSGDNAVEEITFTGVGVADETVTIGGLALTWKASAASESEVTIGANQAASQANLAAAINAHSALKGIVSAAVSGNDVVVTAVQPGRAGNLISIAEAGTNTAITGGATRLAGGDGTQQSAARTYGAV